MKKNKQQREMPVINNLVAKHMYDFQRSHVFVDRKKAEKRGATKHKKERYSCEDRSFFMGMLWV
ncbi:hypothetical protein [Acinetobacter sp.]|uniref:DUF7230 family protein n=1 Tax=Acinetobacter sp. TaxID=472 RepID=UPI0031E05345